jgi:cell division septation protein DedD
VRGPDQVVLRIPRSGGIARAYIHPRLDSVVASVPGVPAIDRVLGFDPEYGVLAFIDDKGQPRRLDLRAAEVRMASREKLSSLSTANGSDLYGIATGGTIARVTPAGDWSFEPPAPARAVFPQRNGGLVIAGTEGGKTSLWLIQPPDDEVLQTATLPLVSRAASAQVGDRIYFAVDSGLVGARTRDLQLVKSIRLEEPGESLVATPSGDRVYVALKSAKIAVVDRYSESVSDEVELPGPASELRMDPLGQHILARPANASDSAWVIGVGNHKVNGTIATEWRADLPAFAPEGAIAIVQGNDVVMIDAATFSARSTVTGGGGDYWHFMSWNGFRPRAAELDRPVTFDTPQPVLPVDSAGLPASRDTNPSLPIRDAAPSMIEPPAPAAPAGAGYMVSFAAVLTEQKAREAAAGIVVNGLRPRVVAGQSGSTTIYRVVLGPYSTREEADRVGRDSKRQYWIYEDTR